MATEFSQQQLLNNDNCSSLFQIPFHLLKSYGEKIPSKVTLKVSGSENKFIVSVEKFKDCYFFTDGWKKFAQAQVDLSSLEFCNVINSEQIDENKRKRSGNGDVKETSSVANEDNSEKKNKRSCVVKGTSSVLNEDKDESSGVEKVSFCRVMKKHHRFRVDMPNGFAAAIGAHKDMKIKLVNGKGRKWPIHVTERVRDGKSFYTMNGGWSAFRKDYRNKLMLGSTVSFTWLYGNMVQTEISGEVTHKQSLFNIFNKSGEGLEDPDA